MTYLTDDEITLMQETQENYLPDTVTIQRVTISMTTGGGWTESWATLTTTCGRLGRQNTQPREGESGGKLKVEQLYDLTLPHDTTIEEDDRVVIDSRTYEINKITRPTNKTALRCIVSEVV